MKFGIQSNVQIDRQQGASLVEFAIVAPILFFLGLGTLQAGILYHGRTILNYATYEAARVGATHHAQSVPMRRELGIRLAPLIGGDGTLESATKALVKMAVEVESPVNLSGDLLVPTKLEILNPTEGAFASWGENSLEFENRRVIPNSHLRQQPNKNQVKGGVTLPDANLLKIRVTHGVEMNVPIVGRLLARLMVPAFADDVDKQLHLMSGRFPMVSTATVRMQSEAWEGAIVEARNKPYGAVVSTLEEIAEGIVSSATDPEEGEEDAGGCGEDGLGPDADEPTSSPVEAPENDLSHLQSQSEDELIASGDVCLAPPPVDPEGSC